MVWKDEYAIGVEHIDRQHKGLFTAANRLTTVLAGDDFERSKRMCIEAIKYLKNYALQHFADEEAYQQSIGYAYFEQHKRQHDAFVETVAELERELVETDFSAASVKRLDGTLMAWLLYHILNSDMAIAGKVKPMEGGALTDIVEDLFIQTMQTMFAIDPEATDSSYAGEISADSLIYAIDYGCGRPGSGYRFILAMEEQHATRMVAEISGYDVGTADELVRSAMEELALVILPNLLRLSQSGKNYIFKGITAIDSGSVALYSPAQPPLCSTLFSSRLGHFVVRAWDGQ